MREKIYLLFNFERKQWQQARMLFAHIGRSDLAYKSKEEFGYSFIFENEEEYRKFLDAAKEYGFKAGRAIRRERIYTPKELMTFPLLHLVLRCAGKGFGGPYYGTKYDMSQACPKCGTGAVQISPLILRKSDAPKKAEMFQTMDFEYLVSPSVAAALKNARFSGLELRQVMAHKDMTPLPWLQLIIDHVMPPMSRVTKGINIENQCPKCKRDGHFDSAEMPEEIHYKGINPDALPDFVHTFECFGNANLRVPFEKSHIVNPLILVKPKVMDFFSKLKVRGLEYAPVIFE